MESYHLFKVHRETFEEVTPTKDTFYLEDAADWTVTAGKMKGNSNQFLNWVMGAENKLYAHYLLIPIPPNFVGILTYESFDWICILPKNENQCTIRATGLNAYASASDSYEKAIVNALFSEDKHVCKRVQTGMKAQYSKGGKLVELERIVIDFHHYLAIQLFSLKSPERYVSSSSDQLVKIKKSLIQRINQIISWKKIQQEKLNNGLKNLKVKEKLSGYKNNKFNPSITMNLYPQTKPE